MASMFVYAMNPSQPERKTGRGVSFVRPDGRTRTIKLGSASKADARDMKSRIESLSRCRSVGTVPSPELLQWLAGIPNSLHDKLVLHGLTDGRPEVVEIPTLAGWCDTHLGERMGSLKPASVLEIERTAELLREYLGDCIRIDAIDNANAKDWRAWLRSRSVGEPKAPEGDPKGTPIQKRMTDSTGRKHVRNAKAIFSAAVKAGLIPSDPFAVLSGASVAAKRDRHITESEADRILDALPPGDYRLLFALARYGALRVPSESHTLTWGGIHWDGGG